MKAPAKALRAIGAEASFLTNLSQGCEKGAVANFDHVFGKPDCENQVANFERLC